MLKFIPWLLSLFLAVLGLVGCKPATHKTEKCTEIVNETLCEKIGQLLIVGFGGLDQTPQGEITWRDPNALHFKSNSLVARDIKDWHVGGVIYFRGQFRREKDGKLIGDRNVQSRVQLSELSRDLQRYNDTVRQQQHLSPFPLFISIDQEGGLINPLVFIKNLPNFTAQARGENENQNWNDPSKRQAALDFGRKYGQITGAALKACGINLDFAPVVDVNINPVNPIIGGLSRSFSNNPDIVADQAQQFLLGLQEEKVLATLKHFPGHGSSTGDSHKGLVDVTNTYQMDKELLPYKKIIDQGYTDFIMSTHVINGQIDRTPCAPGDPQNPENWCPGTMSYNTLTGLLRKQLHFEGVIISDDMSMAAITGHYSLETALEKALSAGVDMFIVANHDANYTPKFVITIAKLVRDGKIPPERIEDAYQHVIAAKQKLLNSQ